MPVNVAFLAQEMPARVQETVINVIGRFRQDPEWQAWLARNEPVLCTLIIDDGPVDATRGVAKRGKKASMTLRLAMLMELSVDQLEAVVARAIEELLKVWADKRGTDQPPPLPPGV